MVTRLQRSRESFIGKGLEVPTAEKLAGVAETTALRRGRVETVDSILNPPVQPPVPQLPIFPQPSPQPSPHIEHSLPTPQIPLCAADEIFSGGICMKKQVQAPTPSPFVPVAPPPAPRNPYASIGSSIFY